MSLVPMLKAYGKDNYIMAQSAALVGYQTAAEGLIKQCQPSTFGLSSS